MKFARSLPSLIFLLGLAAARPASANEAVELRCEDLVPGRDVRIRLLEDLDDPTPSGFLSPALGLVISLDPSSPKPPATKWEKIRVLDSADTQGPHILGLTYFRFGATENRSYDSENVFLTVERLVRGSKKTWRARVNLDNPIYGMIRGQSSDCIDTAE